MMTLSKYYFYKWATFIAPILALIVIGYMADNFAQLYEQYQSTGASSRLSQSPLAAIILAVASWIFLSGMKPKEVTSTLFAHLLAVLILSLVAVSFIYGINSGLMQTTFWWNINTKIVTSFGEYLVWIVPTLLLVAIIPMFSFRTTFCVFVDGKCNREWIPAQGVSAIKGLYLCHDGRAIITLDNDVTLCRPWRYDGIANLLTIDYHVSAGSENKSDNPIAAFHVESSPSGQLILKDLMGKTVSFTASIAPGNIAAVN